MRKLEKKPSSYLFDEEDSPTNIVFVDPKDPEADTGRSPDDPPQVHVSPSHYTILIFIGWNSIKIS